MQIPVDLKLYKNDKLCIFKVAYSCTKIANTLSEDLLINIYMSGLYNGDTVFSARYGLRLKKGLTYN
jgi:hypothetical protein